MKVHCSSSKVPFITDRSLPNINVLGCMLDVEFQENPLKGRSVTAKEVLYSLTKVSFFRDRSRPNLEVLLDMGAESRYGVSGKLLDWKKRYSQEGTVFFM